MFIFLWLTWHTAQLPGNVYNVQQYSLVCLAYLPSACTSCCELLLTFLLFNQPQRTSGWVAWPVAVTTHPANSPPNSLSYAASYTDLWPFTGANLLLQLPACVFWSSLWAKFPPNLKIIIPFLHRGLQNGSVSQFHQIWYSSIFRSSAVSSTHRRREMDKHTTHKHNEKIQTEMYTVKSTSTAAKNHWRQLNSAQIKTVI